MRRAVAFCQVIEPALNPKTHKVSSKNIANMLKAVVEANQEQETAKNSTDSFSLRTTARMQEAG
jgi:hypothetical protein